MQRPFVLMPPLIYSVAKMNTGYTAEIKCPDDEGLQGEMWNEQSGSRAGQTQHACVVGKTTFMREQFVNRGHDSEWVDKHVNVLWKTIKYAPGIDLEYYRALDAIVLLLFGTLND